MVLVDGESTDMAHDGLHNTYPKKLSLLLLLQMALKDEPVTL